MQRTAIVVDDSRVARMTLKKLLVTADFNVSEFGSGEEVIEYLQSASDNPDIIFMDVMMGGMDGLTATKKIKENPNLRAIPVIMCTGNDTQADHDKAVEAGAVTALSKPPESKALANILDGISLHSAEVEAELGANFDEQAFTANIVSSIESQWLPNLDNKIEESITSAIDNFQQDSVKELVNSLITEQLQQQQSDVEARILEVTQRVSHNITEDAAVKMIDERLQAYSPPPSEPSIAQLSEKIEAVVNEKAEAACKLAENNMIGAAAQSVQTVLEEASLPEQINEFFEVKGEEWLTQQEEELGAQLTAQLDALIPSLVSQQLEQTLDQALKKQQDEFIKANKNNKLDEEHLHSAINNSLHMHTTNVFQPLISATINKRFSEIELVSMEQIDELKQDINVLKKISIGLGIAVIGLVLAAIF